MASHRRDRNENSHSESNNEDEAPGEEKMEDEKNESDRLMCPEASVETGNIDLHILYFGHSTYPSFVLLHKLSKLIQSYN